MNPKNIPSKITLTTPEGEFVMEACDCLLCALDIEPWEEEGVWIARTPAYLGLEGHGFCEEEAVNNLLEFISGIPWN